MDFWAIIDAQLAELRSAASADDVMSILSTEGRTADAGFFGGSGGDESLAGALHAAGWTFAWSVADYYWAMTPPGGGQGVHYVEGDVFRGTGRPQR